MPEFPVPLPGAAGGADPRFIVRTHAISTGLPRWRSGVILQFESCQALVKGDVQERKVWISVAGPVRGRRNLLAIIRNDFERIHGDIRKLQPQAMVPVPSHPEVALPYEDLLTFEKEGMEDFPTVVGGKVLKLTVRELLNGVDIERLRKRDELLTRTDAKMGRPAAQAGEEWRKGIDENLQADIILLLVSADFLNSDFCWREEMERALERHQAGEARVIPVIIRKADWTQAKFAKLQALPKEGKAVTLWPDRDSAWTNVAEGIRRVAEEIRSKRSPRVSEAHGGQ
jgi:internalin A